MKRDVIAVLQAHHQSWEGTAGATQPPAARDGRPAPEKRPRAHFYVTVGSSHATLAARKACEPVATVTDVIVRPWPTLTEFRAPAGSTETRCTTRVNVGSP